MSNLSGIIDQAFKKQLSEMGGVQIGRVEAVHDTTVDVQPVINKIVGEKSVPFPLFKDVPVVFPQGGGSYEAFPIAQGDYCLLIVIARCFDNWYIGQDCVSPLEKRMFDYSDCFALFGVNPLAGAIQIPKIKTRVGDCDITGNYTHKGDYTHTGDFTLTGKETHDGDKEQTGNTTKNGNLTVNGALTLNNGTGTSNTSGILNHTGDIIINGVSLDNFIKSHTHTAPDGETGTPNL